MPAVVVDNLSKTYRVADKAPGLRGAVRHLVRRRHRAVHAVRGVSFTIDPGEVVGFLGANGAGKTTVMKMLTGLVHPTSGGVEVLGHEPRRRRADLLRQITLVMGNKQQLVWDLPAGDTLRLNAAVYGIPEAEARRRTDELCEVLGLGRDKELTQPVRKLSLGQRMKCELVAALLHHPKVLFLDEPTLGLDVNAQTAVRDFVRRYNAEHGASVLLTSHYMADITALCDRVVVIHRGRLYFDGRLDELAARFSPERQVRVELVDPADAAALSACGVVESVDGRAATLRVPRDGVPAAVSRLLSDHRVVDLTVADAPIDEVVEKLFSDADQAADQAADADADAKAEPAAEPAS